MPPKRLPTSNPAVYRIVNKVNGVSYIGSSQNAQYRWRSHVNLLRRNSHVNSLLQTDWNEFGCDAFCFEILEYTDVNSLIEREQVYMDERFVQTGGNGYNICPRSDSHKGIKMPEEGRRRLSEYAKTRKFSLETRMKLSESSRGRKKTPEECNRISEFNRKRWQDPEYRAKITSVLRKNNENRVIPIETRAIIAKKSRERWQDPEYHAKNAKIAKENGRKYNNAMMDMDKARELRRIHNDGEMDITGLMEKYSVSKKVICNILHGHTWRD